MALISMSHDAQANVRSLLLGSEVNLTTGRSDRVTCSKNAFKFSGLCGLQLHASRIPSLRGLHAIQNELLCHLLPICTVAAARLHARVLGAVTAADCKCSSPRVFCLLQKLPACL